MPAWSGADELRDDDGEQRKHDAPYADADAIEDEVARGLMGRVLLFLACKRALRGRADETVDPMIHQSCDCALLARFVGPSIHSAIIISHKTNVIRGGIMADTITQEPVSFPSTDGETTIHGYIWRDEDCTSPRGVVQIAHGRPSTSSATTTSRVFWPARVSSSGATITSPMVIASRNPRLGASLTRATAQITS